MGKVGFSQAERDAVFFVPTDAVSGASVVDNDETKMPWYTGPSIFEALRVCGFLRVLNRAMVNDRPVLGACHGSDREEAREMRVSSW